LAVGPNHVFQIANIVGKITNKAGGAAFRFTTASLFNLDPGFEETDPSIIYDAPTDRYFGIVLEFPSDPSDTRSSIIVIVSATGDPKGAYCHYHLGNPVFETFVQDFPHIGISDDKVVVAYNAFTPDGNDFFGAGYYVLNKADLLACGSSAHILR